MKNARIIYAGLLFLLICTSVFPAGEEEKKDSEPTETDPAAVNEAENPVKEGESEKEKPDKPADDKKLKPLPKHILFLDAAKTIKVDLKNKTLQLPAEAEIISSLIEVSLCCMEAPSHRGHESGFVTKAKPSLIHAGLNLIGLKEGKAVEFEGQNKFPTGDGVIITVSWEDPKTKKTKTSRLEKLIYNMLTEEPLDEMSWIFCGGNVVKVKGKKDYYEADQEGTIIATWHHPAAVIDIPLPEGSDDTVFYSYKKAMPPKGTKVIFTFTPAVKKTAEPAKDKKEDKAVEGTETKTREEVPADE